MEVVDNSQRASLSHLSKQSIRMQVDDGGGYLREFSE
jgi:hypothetical protein